MSNQSDSNLTSISLLNQARQNVDGAWEQIVTVYEPLVHSWARRGGLLDQDIADVAQDVFQLVAKNLTRFRKESPDDTFRGWLWTITRNEVRGWYRKRARLQDTACGGTDARNQLAGLPDWVMDDDSIDELESDPATEAQLIRRTADLIRQDFQEHTWQAFWRSAVEGQDTEQIATDLNMKPGAIRQAKLRVLKRFREVLDG